MSHPLHDALAGVGRGLVRAGSVGSVLLAGHAALNARLLRVPPHPDADVGERVSLLLPVRDEAARVGSCLDALLASTGVPDLEVLVLDDGSTDSTAGVVRGVARGDPRLRLLTGAALAAGWLGKPHACAQLAAAATGSVLVFLDADVVLAPDGLARSVALLRATGLALVSPYPRQQADGAAERLVQPLLQWSWLTFLPLRLAERSARPSLAAANGQLLVVDAAAYARAGGHAAVRGEVVEDVALLRAVKRSGGRGSVADGTDVAVTRMYHGWRDLRDGYAKSLWSAGGGTRRGSAAQAGLLALLYLVPPAAALRGSPAGAAGYLAAVAGRVVSARRTGGRAWPDAAAHPVSVAVLLGLTGLSWRRRSAGRLHWKGRSLTAHDAEE